MMQTMGSDIAPVHSGASVQLYHKALKQIPRPFGLTSKFVSLKTYVYLASILAPMKHILMLTKQMPKTTNFNPSSLKKTPLPQTKDLPLSHLWPTLCLEKTVSLNSSTN